MDPGAALKPSKNAVKGLGKAKLSAVQVSETLNATVESVIDALDEIEPVEGVELPDLSSTVSEVTSSSIEGLADLQEDLADDNNFDVSQAVSQIAKGATKGAGALANEDADFDLAGAIGEVSKSAASNLSKLTDDSSLAAKMVATVTSVVWKGWLTSDKKTQRFLPMLLQLSPREQLLVLEPLQQQILILI